jgi:preprotein translocase subunit YajC
MYQSSILAQDSGSGGSSLGLLFFLIIPVAMYFLMIRPQRKRMRQQAELQASIGVGDEVVTNSGIYGFITGEEDDDKFWLEIDENVQIRIARAAIQGRVAGTGTPAVETGSTTKEPADTAAGDDTDDNSDTK